MPVMDLKGDLFDERRKNDRRKKNKTVKDEKRTEERRKKDINAPKEKKA